MGESGLVVVIPAMNEEGTVKQVVTAAREFADVIVVDDGSTDDTFQQALQAGAIVCRLEVNSGYDSALNIGVMKALDLGYARCITLDADGQHDPSIIRAFDLEMNCGAVVVAGWRPHKQRISESLFAMWSRSVMGIHDPLCGMKAYDLNFVDMIGHFDSYRSIGTELLITAAATERTIAELHVPVRPRSDSPRFASAIRANWRIVRALLLGILKYRGLRRHRR